LADDRTSPPTDVALMRKPGPTQAEMVRLGLERDIFSGKLTPGMALEEARIARDYAVSRTPVREAIANLVQCGLVEKVAHKRAVVSAMDAAKLLELFEALAELEALATRLACARMSAADIAELTIVHEEAAALLASKGDDNAYASLGERFHQLLLEGCRNEVLIESTAILANRVYPYRRYQVLAPGRLQRNQDDHDLIVAALMTGDENSAAQAMRQHTMEQGDVLVRFIALHKVTYSELQSRSADSAELHEESV